MSPQDIIIDAVSILQFKILNRLSGDLTGNDRPFVNESHKPVKKCTTNFIHLIHNCKPSALQILLRSNHNSGTQILVAHVR